MANAPTPKSSIDREQFGEGDKALDWKVVGVIEGDTIKKTAAKAKPAPRANAPTPATEDRILDICLIPEGFKKCSICDECLPLEDFHRDAQKRDGRSSWCRPCTKIKAAAAKPDPCCPSCPPTSHAPPWRFSSVDALSSRSPPSVASRLRQPCLPVGAEFEPSGLTRAACMTGHPAWTRQPAAFLLPV
jgi:hypothetical protein